MIVNGTKKGLNLKGEASTDPLMSHSKKKAKLCKEFIDE